MDKIRAILILWVLVTVIRPLRVDSAPGIELFGGYSHLWRDSQAVPGWNGSVSANANRWLGLVADFSGHYFPVQSFGSSANGGVSKLADYRFLFGPQVKLPSAGRLSFRFRAMLGASQSRTHTDGIEMPGYPFSKEVIHYSFTTIETNLCGAVGAAFDVKVTDRLDIRLLQVDYLRNPIAVRYGVGVVVNFRNR